MKRICLISLAFLMLTACDRHSVHPSSEIAVVNVAEIVRKSPSVADINDKLSQDIKPMQLNLQEQQSSLVKQAQSLKDANLSESERTKLKKSILDNKQNLISQLSSLKKAAQAKQTEALLDISHKLDRAIKQYNRKRNNQFKLILRKSFVVYSDDNLNITPEIKERFEEAN